MSEEQLSLSLFYIYIYIFIIHGKKNTLAIWANFSFEFGLVLAILRRFSRFASFLAIQRRQPVASMPTLYIYIDCDSKISINAI